MLNQTLLSRAEIGMDAYVINLNTSTDRWKTIQKEFKGSEIRLHRILVKKEPLGGGYGQFLTCIKLIKMAKSKGLESLLVLEDDCLPAPGWKKRWKSVKKWLDNNPSKWDVYSGGAWGGAHFFQDFTDMIGLYPRKDGEAGESTIFRYPILTLGVHWMYIHKGSYKKLLDYYENVSFITKYIPILNIDTHQGLAFNVVSSYPFIAYQQAGKSVREKTYKNREKNIKTHEKRVGRHFTRKNKKNDAS